MMENITDRINKIVNNGTYDSNFTYPQNMVDDIYIHNQRKKQASMRQNILNTVHKRTAAQLQAYSDDGIRNIGDPAYEDPQDVIDFKPTKPPRKRTEAIAASSPRNKDGRSMLREQKRKLTKKYESLITTLISRCEENIMMISEKDTLIKKLKEKLKSVLEYNQLFADENDQLKAQHETLVRYIEECKNSIRNERERSRDLERKSKELAERVKQFEIPDRDEGTNTAVPLVEVCMSCSSRQIVLQQTRDHNTRLQKDMQAMKDVLYRLNVQLSRYQEKFRSEKRSDHTLAGGDKNSYKLDERGDFDFHLGLGNMTQAVLEEHASNSNKTAFEETSRVVDLSGLLSAQALAPLFDAYQESITEKDTLIQDYEKQFETLNKKSKQILEENKSMSEKIVTLEQEAAGLRQSYKKLVVERETTDIEKATLVERAERAENKLKEVYELYEDKISTMLRDYETVHREYFQVRTALLTCGNKMSALEAARANTVPADLHDQRLQHCKRLLEELKHQYSMENERKSEQIGKLNEKIKVLEEKHDKLVKEREELQLELTAALKSVKQYRKAASVFRQRLKTARESAARLKKRARFKQSNANAEPLRDAMVALHHIKQEIKEVKSRASVSLEELERRLKSQDRQYERPSRHRSQDELKRHHHSRSSSQTPSSPDKKHNTPSNTRLVPTHGGYYQQRNQKM